MKVVILAGGLGSRLAEETQLRPKPMVEIGGRPIITHIMDIYSRYGFNDFYLACGYKSWFIKEYFSNFSLFNSDLSLDFSTGKCETINDRTPPWKVKIHDTGQHTMTGGRIKRLAPYLKDETFMVTYGDGLGNINIRELVDFHNSHGKLATITATRPPARFGSLTIDNNNSISNFKEKPQVDEGWINGGFMVFSPKVLDFIENDETILERDPFERLSQENELMAFKHNGFWQPMDTLREKVLLENLWQSGDPPWKVHP